MERTLYYNRRRWWKKQSVSCSDSLICLWAFWDIRTQRETPAGLIYCFCLFLLAFNCFTLRRLFVEEDGWCVCLPQIRLFWWSGVFWTDRYISSFVQLTEPRRWFWRSSAQTFGFSYTDLHSHASRLDGADSLTSTTSSATGLTLMLLQREFSFSLCIFNPQSRSLALYRRWKPTQEITDAIINVILRHFYTWKCIRVGHCCVTSDLSGVSLYFFP